MTTTTNVHGTIVSNFTSGGTAPGTFFYKGGAGYLLIAGTAGSATLKLQILGPDGVTYIDILAAVNCSVPNTPVNLPPGKYKPIMAGAGGSGIYASLIPAS